MKERVSLFLVPSLQHFSLATCISLLRFLPRFHYFKESGFFSLSLIPSKISSMTCVFSLSLIPLNIHYFINDVCFSFLIPSLFHYCIHDFHYFIHVMCFSLSLIPISRYLYFSLFDSFLDSIISFRRVFLSFLDYVEKIISASFSLDSFLHHDVIPYKIHIFLFSILP
ncbi:unnamed protein product [Acanthosepion pharaonis]|uniref:Uncharacterized protein n=1 Tax=Acanthosepion pharaonis TaxID=158019 RepID=A0A812DD04_ACAPH|nr:unnamed protein product [Sepia pharaonis]